MPWLLPGDIEWGEEWHFQEATFVLQQGSPLVD